METQRDLRRSSERRLIQRRQPVPESMKPFLGWVITEERRINERRRAQRRQIATA